MNFLGQWLRRSLAFGGLLTICFLTACSTPPSQQAAAPKARADATLAPAPSAKARAVGAPAPAPAPGLGTQWGEGRESRVTAIEARRVTPDQPDDLASISYNDAAGVRASAGADPDRQLNLLLANGDVEWSVLDAQNRPLPLAHARRGGDGAFYIVGSQGARYALMFRNLSNRHYEVIATVDGLDVISGQPGRLGNRGYVLTAHGALRIEGFRKSEAEVAAFRFAAPGRAYAANTNAGDVRNIGVLGAVLFELDIPDAGRAPRQGAGTLQPNPFPGDGDRSRYAPPPAYRK